jgi:hypothetical protein
MAAAKGRRSNWSVEVTEHSDALDLEAGTQPGGDRAHPDIAFLALNADEESGAVASTRKALRPASSRTMMSPSLPSLPI